MAAGLLPPPCQSYLFLDSSGSEVAQDSLHPRYDCRECFCRESFSKRPVWDHASRCFFSVVRAHSVVRICCTCRIVGREGCILCQN